MPKTEALLTESFLTRPSWRRSWVLDRVKKDIALWPMLSSPKFGLGLYAHAPMSAFVLELFYGVFCWWVYRGSGILLAVIVVGNLANLSLLSATIAGPEQYLAGHPMIVVTVIFAQIVTMLVLVGVLSSRPPTR